MNKVIRTGAGNLIRLSRNDRITSNYLDAFLIVDTGAEEEVKEEYVGEVSDENLVKEVETSEQRDLTGKSEKLSDYLDAMVDRFNKIKTNSFTLESRGGSKVIDLDDLKKILDLSDGAAASFYIQLNGCRSWKVISYSGQTDKYGNRKLFIHNDIDETDQTLSEANLFNPRYTNIGVAIRDGQFYYAWT